MLGVFRATCWPQQNIEPRVGGGAPPRLRFPLQVRVRLDTPAVHMLPEEQVRTAGVWGR